MLLTLQRFITLPRVMIYLTQQRFFAEMNMFCTTDARDRLGGTPLFHALTSERHDMIQLLLDNGADPCMKDNTNLCPYDGFLKYPKAFKMFADATQKELKNDRNKIKEIEGINNCHVCKKVKNGNKRCTGCYFVFYCGRDCQVKDWETHKDFCKQVKNEYKMCRVSNTPGMVRNEVTKTHFVVKVFR